MNDPIKFNNTNSHMFIMRFAWNKYCDFRFDKIGFAEGSNNGSNENDTL